MKEFTCIVCPNGCRLTCEQSDGGITVTGNQCRRGEAFAVEEMTDPRRTVCTTVRTSFADMPVLPVRTRDAIQKARVFDVMRAVNAVRVTAPIKRGDVVLADVSGTGVDVIATADTPES